MSEKRNIKVIVPLVRNLDYLVLNLNGFYFKKKCISRYFFKIGMSNVISYRQGNNYY